MTESIESRKVEITRRTATQADTDFARSLHHKAFHDVIVRQFGKWDEATQGDFFNKAWRPETHEIILCNAVPCGFVSIRHEPDHIFLHGLVLDPEYQGKGIGSTILEELIEESKQKHIPIRLQVLKENQAQKLYRKLGFKDTGSTDTHFLMEFHSNG